ncbi:MAG: ribose 5-phosphate isomerase B, partial [Dehalococcoidales bacterium]|nr:ribose 5-phosphate isomerase B [Dehalococcoidales bacterium]
MRIAIGCDHRGVELKQVIIRLITDAGHSYRDFGCESADPVDYPDIARKVAEAVAGKDFDRGILICSTGIGMCIAANKVKGIRAALCHNAFTACRARQHNDANVLCLGAEDSHEPISEITDAFLTCEFEGGRHQHRVD